MSGIIVTSPEDTHYNCIAWAAEDTQRFWWPRGGYWPAGIARLETIASFIAAYASLRYQVCDSDECENDFQKIAIFAKSDGTPTHVARQLADGRWTSKLGKSYDIEHDLHTLTTDIPQLATIYGNVVTIMRRIQS